MAGGRFIPKLTFTIERDGSVTVHKYKPGDWESAVEAAEEMAMELLQRTAPSEEELAKVRAEEEEQKRRQRHEQQIRGISEYRKLVRKEPDNPHHWWMLASLFEREEMFKDAENAAKRASELAPNDPGFFRYHEALGKVYLAALSNSVRGKPIRAIWIEPSNVTVESLGYTIEEVRSLAKEYLEKAYKQAKGGASEYSLQRLKEDLDYLEQL